MKIMKKRLLNIIFAVVSLYTINLFTINFNIMIPLNIFSVLLVSLLGLPGLAVYCLIIIKYM